MADRPADGDAVAGVDVAAAALLTIWPCALDTPVSATDSFPT
jgi:hypothetical protein